MLTIYPYDDYPLKPPLNFSASDGTSPEIVHLSWEHAGGSVLPDYYRVLRFDGGPVATFLGTVQVDELPQLDDLTAEPDKMYSYALLRDKNYYFHTESLFDAGFIGLAPPESVVASDGAFTNQVVIEWQPAGLGATPSIYQIHRGDEEDGVYTMIGTSISTTMTDSTVVPGVAYFYKVIAERDGYPDSEPGGPDSGFASES